MKKKIDTLKDEWLVELLEVEDRMEKMVLKSNPAIYTKRKIKKK